MRSKLLEFLKLLEQTLPPHGGHHAITFCRYGNDQDGWEDRLGLHVRVSPDVAQTFFLDDEDFDKPTHELVTEVAEKLDHIVHSGQATVTMGTPFVK